MIIPLGKFLSFSNEFSQSENILPREITELKIIEGATYLYIAENDIDNTFNSRYIDNYMAILNIKSKIEEITKKFSIICIHYKKTYADILRVKNFTISSKEEIFPLLEKIFNNRLTC